MEEVINLSIASQAFFFFQLQLTVRKQFSSIIQYTRMCIYTYWIQAKGQEARLFYIQPTDIFFAFFFPVPCVACKILVPQPGIKPLPLAVGMQSHNQWTTREFPPFSFYSVCYIKKCLLRPTGFIS